jgi:hypothetical protein
MINRNYVKNKRKEKPDSGEGFLLNPALIYHSAFTLQQTCILFSTYVSHPD